MKHIILILLSAFLISCGHNVKTSGVPIPRDTSTVYLVSENKLDSTEIHNAVANELRRSNYNVVDLKDDTSRKVNGTIVKYYDVWGWDLVMLIRSMDIKVIEGRTGKTLSTTSYQQKATFPYPSVKEVVSDMFTEMRAKRVIR